MQQESIAKNLLRGVTEIPHYYIKIQIDAEHLKNWRDCNRHSNGHKASIDSILIHAAARALRSFPRINASTQGSTIVFHPAVNIGFAVSSGKELFAPVVKDADQKDIREIDREVQWLAAKARNGKLDAADRLNGTFTITNLGMYPVEEFSAIINYPQAAILACGRIQKRLLIDDAGMMTVHDSFNIIGSFDHRIVNGAYGAQFLARLKTTLEKELL